MRASLRVYVLDCVRVADWKRRMAVGKAKIGESVAFLLLRAQGYRMVEVFA